MVRAPPLQNLLPITFQVQLLRSLHVYAISEVNAYTPVLVISPCDRYWSFQATVPKVEGGVLYMRLMGQRPVLLFTLQVRFRQYFYADIVMDQKSHIVMEILSHSCGSLPQTRSHMLVLNQFIIRLGFEPFNYN